MGELSLDQVSRLYEGLNKASACLLNSTKALSDAGMQETELFKEVCRIEDEIESLTRRIQPSVFLKDA